MFLYLSIIIIIIIIIIVCIIIVYLLYYTSSLYKNSTVLADIYSYGACLWYLILILKISLSYLSY
jgi:hypothetical protein